eukprot:4577595-Pyramimonas_sp.AAC.2
MAKVGELPWRPESPRQIGTLARVWRAMWLFTYSSSGASFVCTASPRRFDAHLMRFVPHRGPHYGKVSELA